MADTTYVNFMGGSPLNRLGWLRSSSAVMNALIISSSTRWILFSGGKPLLATPPNGTKALAYLSTMDVKSFLGKEFFFGQGEKEGDPAGPDLEILQSARHRGSPVVFLGLEEPKPLGDASASALPSSEFTDPEKAVANLSGDPYFAMEVGQFGDEEVDKVIKGSKLSRDGTALEFVDARAAMRYLDAVFQAGLFAEARSMVDWNDRNAYCAGCGSRTYPIWAGWKRSCSSRLPWVERRAKPCPTERGLHNFMHPRTDPVVIMVAVNQQGDKVLLGRSKKFPGKFYSALAGFVEPGESFEDAVIREIWEEAGVKVWDVRYHSGQPWPYPANLMVGFFATADSSKPIRIDLDNELEDARWFTRDELRAVLTHVNGTYISRKHWKKLGELEEGRVKTIPNEGAAALAHSDPKIEAAMPKEEVEEKDEPPFKVPPLTAIAGVLLQHWVDGKDFKGPQVSSNL